MEDNEAIHRAIAIVEKREKRLSMHRKSAYAFLLFGFIYSGIFMYGFSKADDVAILSKDLNEMVQSEEDKILLSIVDAKINLAFEQDKLKNSLMPIAIGFMFGGSIGTLLSLKTKSNELDVFKNVLKNIEKNS